MKDNSNVTMVDHIMIEDMDTGEVLVNQRGNLVNKVKEEDDDE